MDTIAIAVQVGNALTVHHSKEMSLLNRHRRNRPSVAQARLIRQHYQPIAPFSPASAVDDAQPTHSIVSPREVVIIDVSGSPPREYSEFGIPEEEVIVDYMSGGDALVDANDYHRRTASSSSSVVTLRAVECSG